MTRPGPGQLVINEIHYDPPDRTAATEFVELHNPGGGVVDLSGWSLRGGVEFPFARGTTVAAGGFLVVAQDPASFRRRFGAEAMGPWSGRLANRGEQVELRDQLGAIVDEVGYQLGFPWPTVGRQPEVSIELIHPSLDNDLGGHWRVSVQGGTPAATRTALVERRGEWRFFRGRSEPSSPRSAWRDAGFADDDWETGPLPIGYDPGLPMGTSLDDMRGEYLSAYLRREFAVEDPGSVTALEVEALYDDGFRMWINGREVLTANLAGGELPFDAAAGPARESNDYETFEVSLPPGLLRSTGNWVAVQAHNSSLSSSSDFYFDARIVGVAGPTGLGPTPGRANVAFGTRVPPAIRQVEHAPRKPKSGEPVRISARVTDPDGVQSVILSVQRVDPGAYLDLADPAYATRWDTVAMGDDGQGGDAVAGDEVYTAVLDGSVQRHRRLVRYRITAEDRDGAEVRVPYADDPQPNFAYFVYDGVPAWRGAIRPGAADAPGRVFTVPADEMNRLPVLHLIAKKSAVEESTWLSRYRGEAYPWAGTLVFDGEVYDHIRHRARGGVWRYAMGKNMWKFDFNRGHDFRAVDDWGRRLEVGWTKLNLGASIQQGDYEHRGEQGMFESVGFRIFRLAGVPAMHSAFVQFRVIDDAEEAPADNQYEGDFWGVYLMLEQPDGRFLDQHGLADGNLYKMEGGTGELNHLGSAGPADGSDLREFLGGYNGASEAWWRENFDIDRYLSYQTVVQAIHHYDICYDKNFFYHRDPVTGRWQVLPWDLDLTWAENMYDPGCGGVDRIKERLLPEPTRFPGVWRAWQNRIREFRDLFWNTDEAWRLIDEQAARLRGPSAGSTVLDADRAQWDYNPRMRDGRYTDSPEGKAGWGRFYRWSPYPASEVSREFSGAVQLMKRYVGFRATNLAARARALDRLAADPQIPARPRLAYTGPEAFPVNALRFRSSAYSGSAPLAARRWRVGEVSRPETGASGASATEPARYEIEPVWESGAVPGFEAEMQIPEGALREGRTYRARVQFEDAEGRSSQWSEPVEFTAGSANNVSTLQGSLRLTELMYNSIDGAANDFVELHNAGTTPLALGGVSFSEGITYTFPAGASLPAGGYLLVVRADPAANYAAFRALYGLAADVPIYGPYSGNLSDGGERLAIRAPGGGSEILAVTYSDGRGWPVAADAAGHSLVPRVAVGSEASGILDYAGSWRASTRLRGSPGRVDPEPDPAMTVVLNEVVAHTDFLSEFDSNDWVEVYQRGDVPFVFGPGWYLSDDPRNLRRWQIPAGTTVPARGFVVFDEVTGFNRPTGTGFSLNKAGEQVFLSYFSGGDQGGVVDAISFKGQENDWALARVPDGGDYWDQVAPRTRGAANAAVPPRVIVSEILFHEGGLPTNNLPAASLEFLELHNPTAQPVRLYNTNAVWRINGGIEFDLPLFTTLAAGERVVLVSFDPIASPAALAGFRQTFSIPATVRIFGPYVGRLNNDTDRVALERAQAPDVPGDPITWVIVDEVLYFDRAPWPADADGQGRSLNRQDGRRPGSDPAAWVTAAPTPGAAPGPIVEDSDGDGLPDAWETRHGLDPRNPADAVQDADGDGASNAHEYAAGTDPRNAASALQIDDFDLRDASTAEAVFTAVAGRSYRLEVRQGGAGGAWEEVTTLPAGTADRVVAIPVPYSAAGGSAFFRLVIP